MGSNPIGRTNFQSGGMYRRGERDSKSCCGGGSAHPPCQFRSLAAPGEQSPLLAIFRANGEISEELEVV